MSLRYQLAWFWFGITVVRPSWLLPITRRTWACFRFNGHDPVEFSLMLAGSVLDQEGEGGQHHAEDHDGTDDEDDVGGDERRTASSYFSAKLLLALALSCARRTPKYVREWQNAQLSDWKLFRWCAEYFLLEHDLARNTSPFCAKFTVPPAMGAHIFFLSKHLRPSFCPGVFYDQIN